MKANNQTQATGLQVFYNEISNVNIRMKEVSGEPWFVAKDVCDALTISNSRDAINRLDDDEKAMSVLPTQFGDKEMNIVNESGLYKAHAQKSVDEDCTCLTKYQSAPVQIERQVTYSSEFCSEPFHLRVE